MSVELIALLRRKLRDTGSLARDYFAGDGESDTFTLSESPVKPGTAKVFVDNSLYAATEYTLDGALGQLVLDDEPDEGELVKVVYVSYLYSDTDIERFLDTGIAHMNSYLTTEYDLDDDLGASERSLLLLLALKDAYLEEMLDSARTNFSWRDEEKSVNKNAITGGYAEALDALDEQIEDKVKELTLARTGYVRSGGTEPAKFDNITR